MNSAGAGGTGGGGTGGTGKQGACGGDATSYGSGGGGAGYQRTSGAGYQGVVVIRYTKVTPVTKPTLSAAAGSLGEYTGTNLKPTVSPASPTTGVTYTWSPTGDWKDAGNAYTFTATLSSGYCWSDGSTANYVVNYSITKATITFEGAPTPSKSEWEEGDTSVTVTKPTSNFGQGTMVLAYYTDSGCTAGRTVTMPTTEGTYWVRGEVPAADNWNAGCSPTASFTILKSGVQVTPPTVTPDPAVPIASDGYVHQPIVVNPETDKYDISYGDSDWTSAGTHTLTLTFKGGADYRWSDTKSSAPRTYVYTITAPARYDYLQTDGVGYFITDYTPHFRTTRVEFETTLDINAGNAALAWAGEFTGGEWTGSKNDYGLVYYPGSNRDGHFTFYARSQTYGYPSAENIYHPQFDVADKGVHRVFFQGEDLCADGVHTYLTPELPNQKVGGPLALLTSEYEYDQTNHKFRFLRMPAVKLYSVRIYEGDSTEPVREYLPATNTLGQATLYETRTGTYLEPKSRTSKDEATPYPTPVFTLGADKVIQEPTGRESFTYDGLEHRPIVSSDKYTLYGDYAKTVAGNYTVKVRPNGGYCWSDRTHDERTLEWRIDGVPLPTPTAMGNWGWSNLVTVANRQYCVVAFTNVATHTWTVPQGVGGFEFLVVAGGGGGGTCGRETNSRGGGGGGAGGMVVGRVSGVSANTKFNINVGKGGDAATAVNAKGENGGPSGFGTGDSGFDYVKAFGGGAGGSGNASGKTSATANGSQGGCGGGGAGLVAGTATGGAVTVAEVNQSKIYQYERYGSAGGGSPHKYCSGGGGGAGGAGGDAYWVTESSGNAGDGGSGVGSPISGDTVMYAMGGAGCEAYSNRGAVPTVSSGNGGHGERWSSSSYSVRETPDPGSSGIVIFRYAVPEDIKPTAAARTITLGTETAGTLPLYFGPGADRLYLVAGYSTSTATTGCSEDPADWHVLGDAVIVEPGTYSYTVTLPSDWGTGYKTARFFFTTSAGEPYNVKTASAVHGCVAGADPDSAFTSLYWWKSGGSGSWGSKSYYWRTRAFSPSEDMSNKDKAERYPNQYADLACFLDSTQGANNSSLANYEDHYLVGRIVNKAQWTSVGVGKLWFSCSNEKQNTIVRNETGLLELDAVAITVTGTGEGAIETWGGATTVYQDDTFPESIYDVFKPDNCDGATIRANRDRNKSGWLTGGAAATTQYLVITNSVLQYRNASKTSGVAGQLGITIGLDSFNAADEFPLSFAGAFNVNAGSTLSVNAGNRGVGTYALISAGTLNDGANLHETLDITGYDTDSYEAHVVREGSALYLVIEERKDEFVWAGGASGTWATAANWNPSKDYPNDALHELAKFESAAEVTVDADIAVTNVNVVGSHAVTLRVGTTGTLSIGEISGSTLVSDAALNFTVELPADFASSSSARLVLGSVVFGNLQSELKVDASALTSAVPGQRYTVATYGSYSGGDWLTKAGVTPPDGFAVASVDNGATDCGFTLVKLVGIPKGVTLPYTGSEQVGVSYNASLITATGTTAATVCGTYSATLTLNNTTTHMWEDYSTGEKTVVWSIGEPTLTEYYWHKTNTQSNWDLEHSGQLWYKDEGRKTLWDDKVYPNATTARAILGYAESSVSQNVIAGGGLSVGQIVMAGGTVSLLFGDFSAPDGNYALLKNNKGTLFADTTKFSTGSGYYDLAPGTTTRFGGSGNAGTIWLNVAPNAAANARTTVGFCVGRDGHTLSTFGYLTGGTAGATVDFNIDNAVVAFTSTTVASGLAGTTAFSVKLGASNTTETAALSFAGAFTIAAGSTLTVDATAIDKAGTYPLITAGTLTDNAGLVDGATVTAASGMVGSVRREGNGLYLVLRTNCPVAQVGATTYTTLEDAFAAAQDGDTVALLTNVVTKSIRVTKNVTLAGDVWEVALPKFTVDSGKTLTITNGYFGVDAIDGTYRIVGGKYVTNTTFTVASGYHYAKLASIVQLYNTYSYQVIAGEAPTDPTVEEIVFPALKGTNDNYIGEIRYTLKDLEEKGITGTTAEIVTNLNTIGANKNRHWENLVLGLSHTDTNAVPVLKALQTDNSTMLSLKLEGLDHIDYAAGATVRCRVMYTDKEDKTEWLTDGKYYTPAQIAEQALPKSGVRYYRVEIEVIPAK